MSDPTQDLTFHTRFERPAHGCLPLFAAVAFILVLGGLWFVPVVQPAPVKLRSPHFISLRHDSLTSFLVLQNSPLTLIQPWGKDPDYEEQRRLPLTRDPQPEEAPALPVVPTTYDSAVLHRDELLELPPGYPTAEEVAP